MKPTRKISRRSFLGTVAGGAVLTAAMVTVAAEPALATQTDSDPGDRPGRGRTGITDGDPGDPVGRGRGRRRRSGITDRDPGDPVGRGRGRRRVRRCTDRDPGDPAGRRC